MKKIWLSPPHLSGNEMRFIRQALASNYLAPTGPHVDAFEQKLASYVNLPQAAALSSGTAALHLALKMLDIGPGDIVICPTFTFAASANPITYLGATPVFVDSEETTWNICPNILEDAIKHFIQKGKRPKAVIGVHIYGMPMQLDEVLAICDQYGVPLIEDAAEALGSAYKGKKAGTFGTMSIFSFNGNKIITTSGGGALLSQNENYVSRARFLASQAKEVAPHYQHAEIGYNYRLSNICAAIGLAQWEVIDQRVNQRRDNFEFYRQELQGIPGISFQTEPADYFSNRWLTCILIDPIRSNGLNRENIRLLLEKKNIESRPLWKPLHMQPVFKDAPYFGGNVAGRLFEVGLCLPSGSDLGLKALIRINSIIKKALQGREGLQ
jgi:dTDP-4-amino-4,6-dideoxygalactose transaminase